MSNLQNSGAYWLGEIPKDWKMLPAWALFAEGKEKCLSDDPHLVPSRVYGVVTRDRLAELSGNKPVDNEASAHHMKHVEPHNFIISMGSHESGIEHSRLVGKVSNDYRVLLPTSGVNPEYYKWFFKSEPLIEGLRGLTTEIRVGQRIHYSRFSLLRLPLPPAEDQQRIADYLDRETAEIDAAVADLDKYVELLEKRRRALVHETLVLRKGPGSGLSISDSQRGRVGFVTRLLRRGISPSYVDEGVPVINQKCVRTGGFLDIASCRFHDSGARNIGLDLTIQPGDTLINSTGTGTLGRSCTVGEISVPTTWDSHVTLVRPNIDIADPGYLGWTILSQESKLVEFSTGSTNQIELSRDTIFNLDFVSIPLDLQKEVSAYLNRETAEIDSLIAESTTLRDLLLKRRSVLITEVVTGRKQV